MTFEQALIAAVAGLATALVVLWQHTQRREDKIHNEYRAEREKLLGKLQETRSEFTQVLLQIAGIETKEDGQNASRD